MTWPAPTARPTGTGVAILNAARNAAKPAPPKKTAKAPTGASKAAGFARNHPPTAPSAESAPDGGGDPAAGLPDPTIPFDANAEQQISGVQARYDIAMSTLAARRATLDKAFGARDGQLNWVDPADPWARTAVLRRQFFANREAQTGRQFGAGTGYDGSSELQDAFLAADQGKIVADTQRSYNEQLGAIKQGEKDSGDALANNTLSPLDAVIQRFYGDPTASVAPTTATAPDPAPAAPAPPPKSAAPPKAPAKPKAKAKAKPKLKTNPGLGGAYSAFRGKPKKKGK